MPVRDDPRAFLLPPVAPLSEALAFHLAKPYVRELPKADRPTGRPKREEGGLAGRKERQLQLALQMLTPRIRQEQETIFQLLTPVLQAGELTDRWLRNELEKYLLTPSGVLDPRRLREWHQENLLLYSEEGKPEAQSAAALLLMRRLDCRKERGWLPPGGVKVPSTFVCWRYDAPGLPPVPYELPLARQDESHPSVLVPTPEEMQSPYILCTPWKGAVWASCAWVLVEHGAIRWVGTPREDQCTSWLSSQERGSLVSSTSLAKEVLCILAVRFLTSGDSPQTTQKNA